MDKNQLLAFLKRKAVWITLLVVVVLTIVWLIFSLWPKSSEPNIYSTEDQPIFKAESPSLSVMPTLTLANQDENTVQTLSRNFAERFGTWSTDNQGVNLQQLKSLGTKKLQTYLDNIKINYQTAEFYGVTTKALAPEIKTLDSDNGTAQVLVSTQKIEVNEKGEEHIYYQKVLIDLVKFEDTWLVDVVKWQ